MIISRTPFRVSFFGGGTDYPAWYREHGGQVLGTAINKYCYITCRYLPPFFEHKYRVVYSRIEDRQSIDEIVHPAAREVLRYLDIEQGIEIHHDGDLPARSGIGSSSSFTVGLLNAAYALKGRMVAKGALAKEAIYIEQDRLRETVGSQDQVFAAYGGLNHIAFLPNDEVTVTPLTLKTENSREFAFRFMLFFTGIKRTASNVAQKYAGSFADKERSMKTISSMVDEATTILRNEHDLGGFGKLMHEGWRLKRGLDSAVSNSEIDELYSEAVQAGALGGKLIGAGGGGFIVLFVSPRDHGRVRERLARLIHVPVKFDYSGSRIIFFDPEEDFSEHARRRDLVPVEAFREAANIVDASVHAEDSEDRKCGKEPS